MIGITVSLSIIFMGIVFGSSLKRFLKRLAVPGPLLPKGIQGNLVDFMAAPREFGPRMVEEHGPLYRFYNNNFGTLLAVADPNLARDLFQADSNMAHPWDLGLGHFLHRFLSEAMGLAFGRKWSKIRKAFRAPMSTKAADNSLSNIEASLDRWEEETLEQLAKSGKEVNLQKVVGTMPIDVMLNIFFGHPFVTNHKEQFDSLSVDAEAIMTTVMGNKVACTSLYKHLNTDENATLARFQENWNNILLAYESSQERLEGEGGVFDAVVEHMDSSHSDGITFKEVADTMAEIIFTNQDVLNPAITWVFADLMVYPNIVKSLELLGTRGMMDKSALENDHPQLLNLIKESARAHPFFPLSMPEVLSKDLTLGGFFLPKGTCISVDQYSINHNASYWKEPKSFRPERFENLDEFTAKWGLFRFGFGARRCPGQYYANLVMANVIARLLSRWKLVPVGLEGVKHHEEVPITPGNFAVIPDILMRLERVHGNAADTEGFAASCHLETGDGEIIRNEFSETRSQKHTTIEAPETNIQLETSKDAQTAEESVQGALEILRPIFRPGSDVSCLASPGLMVGVSVLPNHPLLSTNGSQTLISFLASLPHPNAIFVCDSLNKHNVKAMIKNANKPPSDEVALATALEAGQPFHKFLGDAIKDLETTRPDKIGWVTLLTWNQVTDNDDSREQQAIVRNYYDDASSRLKTRVDQIATDFLKFRRPQSKNHSARLPHMVNYLLAELPICLTGFEHKGTQFTTLAYPTAASKVSSGEGSCLANSVWDLAHDIHTNEEFNSLRQELLQVTKGRENLPGVLLLPMSAGVVAKEKDIVVINNEVPRATVQQETSKDAQTAEESVQGALEILRPIFRPGSDVSCLASPGLMVGVSVLPNHPLLSTNGSRTLVSFLAHLPHPSAIVIGDSLNKHNVKAMCRNANKPPSDDVALATALEAGQPFHKFLGGAIKDLEMTRPDKTGWVTLLTWNEATDSEESREQDAIIQKHYNDISSSLKTRIDEIATDFLKFRRPQSKNHAARLPHMVNYLLAELPWCLNGFEHNGHKFNTLLYPTAVSKVSGGRGSCLANSLWDLTHDIHTKEEFSDLRKELLQVTRGREGSHGVLLLPMDVDVLGKEKVVIDDKKIPEAGTKLEKKRMARMFKRQVSAGGA